MRTAGPALVLCVMFSAAAVAQEENGGIYGTVRDASGLPAPGLRVEAHSVSTGLVLAASTDVSGFYRFPALAPGRFDIIAQPAGAGMTRVSGVVVALGWTLKLDLQLGRGEIQQDTPGILRVPIESASVTNVRDQRLDNQPRGRDYTSVTLQAPGSNYEYKLGGVSIDGSSAPENRYFVDGVDTSRLDIGLPGKELPTDLVDDVQIKSSGYAAEYGGSTGAAVNVMTRSGGSGWHGEAILYFASDLLGGNSAARARGEDGAPPLDQDRPVLRLDPAGSPTAELVKFADDEFLRFEPGLAVSGPLWPRRAWLFAAYLPRLESITRPVAFLSTGAERAFERRDKTHFASLTLTAHPSDVVRARVTTHFSPYSRTGALPDIRGTDNPAVDYEDLDRREPNVLLSASVDWLAGTDVTVGLRAGYFHHDTTDQGVPNAVQHVFSRSNAGLPGVPTAYQRATGFSDIPSNAATTRDLQTRFGFRAEASYATAFAGRHMFKGGVQLDRLANDLLRGEQQPVVTLAWNATLTASDGRRVRGSYGYYRVRQRVSAGNVTAHDVGLFLQDAWTINERLTINLGVRADREQVPSYATSPGYAEYAIVHGFGDKIAPRAGVAWDARGDGAWSVYGSWGLFYDTMKLDLARGLFGGFRWIDYRYTLDTFDWAAIGGASCPPTCPGTLIEALDIAPPSNDPAHNLIDPGLRPMRSREVTAGVRRRLGTTGSTGVRYVRKRLDRAVEDVGILIPGQGYSYFIANPGFGTAEYTLGPAYPAQPRARRDYDGIEAETSVRFGSLLLHGTYLWSRLYGNYSGLANSDEASVAPDITGAFDLLQQSFDEQGTPVFGRLATDRPHQIKLQAGCACPFDMTLGANVFVLSGTPVTRSATMQNAIVFYRGRGSDGRTDTVFQADLYVQRELRLGARRRLRLSVNVLNVFDQDAVTSRWPSEYRESIPISGDDFFRGFDVAQRAAQNGIPRDPRFLLPQTYQPSREAWVAVKLLF